jgi:RimJ/RimL family protein N-acetyltransferase
MSFDLQPILKGKLLHLRPLREEDWDDLFAVAADPFIWEQHPEPDRYTEKVFREFFREAMASGGALIVTDAQDGEVIGSSRYNAYDPVKSEIEIGWTFLARRYWGGEYNLEMKQLMLQHAFQFVRRVNFLVGPQNFRSQKAMEKIGGARKGSRIDPKNGRENVVFEIEKSVG